MKKSTVLCGIAAAMLAFSAVPSVAEEITPESHSRTDCKHGMQNVQGNVVTRGYEDPLSSWSIDYNDGKLTVTWHDFIGNCALLDIETNIYIEGDRIIFSAIEVLGELAADCLCPYDATSTFEGIAPGHYQIVFKYEGCVEVMTVDVDLEEGYKGFFKVQEDAVRELAASDGSLVVKNGIVKVASPGRFSLDVFSASGVKEYTLEENDETELSLRGFAKGIHFLRLTPADGKTVTLPVLL